MATKIAWTDKTWNPVTGCTPISPGCQNCFAKQMTKRLQAMGSPKYAAGFDTVVCHPGTLEIPLRWKRPRRVFVNSMSDLFHEDVPDEFIDKLFAVMSFCPQHTFQVLTKRPERMAEYLHNRDWSEAANWVHNKFIRRLDGPLYLATEIVPPLPNVHLGTSVESQDYVSRIGDLLKCPGLRFVSFEPLLEPVDPKETWDPDRMYCRQCGHIAAKDEPYESDDGPDDPDESWPICPECGGTNLGGYASYSPIDVMLLADCPFPPIDWAIIGCESGSKRRPCELESVKGLVDQCDVAGVPTFVKQLDALRCRCGRVYFVGEPFRMCPECGMHECYLKPFVSTDPAEWPSWAWQDFPESKEPTR